MQQVIDKILIDVQNILLEVKNTKELDSLRIQYLGKNGEMTNLLKALKDVPNVDKPRMGKLINEVKVKIESDIDEVQKNLFFKEREAKIDSEKIDVTLSKKDNKKLGTLHPLTLIKNDIINTFIGLGFTIKDGPEMEYDYYNFEALNIPKDHPSRDSQDTFYINDNILLRSQTSAVQVRVMENEEPPIRILCPGKVYRSDDDASHSPMFQQIEGLVVDKNITLCDLQGILDQFAKSFFNKSTKTRFRPSHFPFTEPSVEVDLSCAICGGKGCRLCKGTGWIEILGAGVVNPIVLDNVGIDSKVYSGFAFGMGVERVAMIKYGIPDLRIMFENDVRYLKQYR